MELEKIKIDPTLLTYVARPWAGCRRVFMTYRRLRTCPAAAGRFIRS